MRTSTIVMIAFAVVFGLLAVFIAQSWLNSQAEMRMKSLEANKKPIATRTIVVAGKSLRFGSELSGGALREIPWPEQAIPAGAFATVADLTKDGRRVVLSPIEANEPILGWKITGPGQRATLSAMLRDGLKAVTIRVNDVEGVAGFVLPGDYVDVALTRQNDKTAGTTDIILQSARVLAIDQMADERADKPSVVKAVTLEVDTTGAQKISLAASIGTHVARAAQGRRGQCRIHAPDFGDRSQRAEHAGRQGHSGQYQRDHGFGHPGFEQTGLQRAHRGQGDGWAGLGGGQAQAPVNGE